MSLGAFLVCFPVFLFLFCFFGVLFGFLFGFVWSVGWSGLFLFSSPLKKSVIFSNYFLRSATFNIKISITITINIESLTMIKASFACFFSIRLLDTSCNTYSYV